MTALTISLACAAVIAAFVTVLALVALRRSRREATREAAVLRERLDDVESQLRARASAPTGRAEPEYVITRLGELQPARDEAPVPVRLTAPAFADAVVREVVVQTASLVQGVRRALAPEARNRIRFEMKREVKRSRKSRKVEVKEALREYRARHRAETPDLPTVVDVVEVAGSEGAA